MENDDVVYEEFLLEFLSSEIDFQKDNFKVMLVSSNYEPDKSHNFEYVKSFESNLNLDSYQPGGTNINFKLDKDTIKIDYNKMSNIVWKNLTGDVKYIVTYRIGPDNKKVNIVCQNLGLKRELKNESLAVNWGEVFLKLGQKFLEKPIDPPTEDNLGILQTGVLGSMILGKESL